MSKSTKIALAMVGD